MPNLTDLRLNRNQISDAGMAALASALQGGALPSCIHIILDANQISDSGVAALATALRGGALPSCTRIVLRYDAWDRPVTMPGITLSYNPGANGTNEDTGDLDGSCPAMVEALESPERAAALARCQAE